MAQHYMQLALTPAVQRSQDKYFGRHQTAASNSGVDPLTPEEITFVTQRDSFYMATVNADGWPYLQHRGGPPGFLKVIAPNRIGFADLKGNRQLLSTGNLEGDDRVSLFLMDYPNRERLKILGHAQVLDARENPELADQLSPSPELRRLVERLFLIDVVAYDWNCPQFITPRYTPAEIEIAVAPLREHIASLEAELRKRPGANDDQARD